MQTTILHYSKLSLETFHDLVALRISVFVVEQNCPYQELDGNDKNAFHVIVRDEGNIIGTARILNPGVAYQEPAIGRVVSASSHRHAGVGHLIMQKAMAFIENHYGQRSARLSAQTHLVKFYEHHGFVSTGKTYLEDNIPHTEMVYRQ
jgi:ElaA protein